MRYEFLPDLVRNTPLAAAYVNALRSNINWLWNAFLREHNVDGKHNAQHIPRCVFNVNGTTKHGDAEGLVTSISSASGVLQFSIPTSVFGIDTISIVAQPWAVTTNRPTFATVGVVDTGATLTVQVKFQRRTAIDANTWENAPTIGSIALFSTPTAQAPKQASWQSAAGEKLRDFREEFNLIVRRISELRAAMTAEHATSGAHTQTARAPSFSSFLAFDFDAATYSEPSSFGGGVGASATGTGEIELTALSTSISDAAVFLSPAVASPDQYRNNLYTVSPVVYTDLSSVIRADLWAFSTPGNSGQWRKRDCDLSVVVHEL
jgi:hypothetical protein